MRSSLLLLWAFGGATKIVGRTIYEKAFLQNRLKAALVKYI